MPKKKTNQEKQQATQLTYRLLQNWQLLDPLLQLCTPLANAYRAHRLEQLNQRLEEISAREAVLNHRLEELESPPEEDGHEK